MYNAETLYIHQWNGNHRAEFVEHMALQRMKRGEAMVFVSKENRINAWSGNETDPDAVIRCITVLHSECVPVVCFLRGETKRNKLDACRAFVALCEEDLVR